MKYQVIIIGGGPAGYTAAETAGKGGLSVLLIAKKIKATEAIDPVDSQVDES